MRLITTLILLSSFMLVLGCGSAQKTGLPEATKETLDNIPKWYKKPPTDPNFIFGRGTGVSMDLATAEDKASIDAEGKIAKQIETKFEGLEKKFTEEVGTDENAQFLAQFTKASKAVVSTTLSGINTVNSDFQMEGGRYRAYVLMRMPVGASSEALLKKLKQQEQMYTRFRSSEVFKELERDTEKFEQFKKEQAVP